MKAKNLSIIILLFEVSFVLIVILFFIGLHSSLQSQIQVGGGFGWDGLQYKKIYDFFLSGDLATVAFPFCNRIGTPFLASLLNGLGVTTAFKVVNLTFAAIFSFSTYFICKSLGFPLVSRLFALFLTIVPFFSPVRFTAFYPVYTDPAFLAFLSLGILSLVQRKYTLSLLLVVMAYPFREAAIYVLAFFAVAIIYIQGFSKKVLISILVVFFIAFILKISVAYFFDCSGSQLRTAIDWVMKRLTDPEKFINYCAAVLMTAAPLWFLRDISILNHIEKISLAGFFFSAVLAFAGGTDSTRIFYSFSPLYLVLIIRVIATEGFIFSMFCAIGYILSNRFGRPILEPINYRPARDDSGYFWQFPDFARPEVGLLIIAVWIIIFLLYNKLRSQKIAP
jgi:hypothetical protein